MYLISHMEEYDYSEQKGMAMCSGNRNSRKMLPEKTPGSRDAILFEYKYHVQSER